MPRKPPLMLTVALLAAFCPAARVQAAEPSGLSQSAHAVTLLALDHAGGHSNARPQGLAQWLFEARRRTSIDLHPEAVRVDMAALPELFARALPASPLFVWQGDDAFEPLPETGLAALGRALRAGGALFVDASDGIADGPFEKSVTRELRRMLPNVPLVPIPSDHVLYRSFYLIDRHTGRTNARPALLGMSLEGRLAVVLSANDLGGAIAKDSLGGWAYAVSGGERAREMATRLCINWIMYVLCLDYKADQVHLPFILKRRR